MNIAVTYEDGNIFQHFGHCVNFKVYEVSEDNEVISTKIITSTEGGHSVLSGFLADNAIDMVICGGIGGGAQNALKERGIKLFGGVSGNADDAVYAYLAGKLQFNPNVECTHHKCGGEHTHCHGPNDCKHE